jgi:hypothetical protein
MGFHIGAITAGSYRCCLPAHAPCHLINKGRNFLEEPYTFPAIDVIWQC